jgi:hypothetical protein
MAGQDPMRSAGRRISRIAAVALVVVAVGPAGAAMADQPHVTITSPPSPVNGSVINNPTPSFEGTGDPDLADGGPVTLTIYRGKAVGGTVVQELKAKQEQWLPLERDGGTWWVGPEQELKALQDGTYTAQAKQITEPSPPEYPEPEEATASVTFTVDTGAPGPPPVEPPVPSEPPPTATPPATPPGAPAATAPPPPAASFSWFPSLPKTGENVSLVSTSTDLVSPITGFAWGLTGDGSFRGGGPLLTTSFSTPGGHVVRLRVTDANGATSVATQTIPVSSAPLVLIQPFPIVRIAGSETSSGVRLRLLAVQAPVGAKISVSCTGRGCPARSQGRIARSRKRKAGTVLVEFRRFERSLRAGVTLQIRVSKPGEIGKYTRFVVRRGKLPQRSDMCLDAAGRRPLVCPSS